MNIGAVIHWYETCASTNDEAKILARQGAREGTVVIADEQTGGKGTKGRAWFSPRSRGLYASVILRPPSGDVSLLPLVAGIAAAEAIRLSVGLEVELKWPNDVVWSGKKIGGILCESEFVGDKTQFVVLGIGLNINQSWKDFPAAIRKTAASLRMILKRRVDGERIEQSLCERLDWWYKKFVSGEKAEILRAFEAKLSFPIGKVVIVRTEKETLTGTLRGFSTGASMILEKDGEEILLSPAEILGLGYHA
ncbi:MAG: biotin--[acetyl-CoA-carboxylase] ligase [Clostridiales bacterium]|nr:biotin--[acetyl-CoA-carboxylase] ligase [Clostridiales bacterium]